MNSYNKINKFITLFLLSILMISSTGCYSIKELSKNDIQNVQKKIYFIHEPHCSYQLTDVTIIDGLLSGRLDSQNTSHKKSFMIHIYLASDSSIMKIGNVISVQAINIVRAEEYRLHGFKSLVFLGTICIAMTFIILILAGGYDM